MALANQAAQRFGGEHLVDPSAQPAAHPRQLAPAREQRQAARLRAGAVDQPAGVGARECSVQGERQHGFDRREAGAQHRDLGAGRNLLHEPAGGPRRRDQARLGLRRKPVPGGEQHAIVSLRQRRGTDFWRGGELETVVAQSQIGHLAARTHPHANPRSLNAADCGCEARLEILPHPGTRVVPAIGIRHICPLGPRKIAVAGRRRSPSLDPGLEIARILGGDAHVPRAHVGDVARQNVKRIVGQARPGIGMPLEDVDGGVVRRGTLQPGGELPQKGGAGEARSDHRDALAHGRSLPPRGGNYRQGGQWHRTAFDPLPDPVWPVIVRSYLNYS